MNKVERSQAIGVVLIVLLLLGYVFYVAPQTTPPDRSSGQPPLEATGDSISKETKNKQQSGELPVLARRTQPQGSSTDSLMLRSAGVFAPALLAAHAAADAIYRIETEDLELHISPRGGALRAVRLKQYRTHTDAPLWLMDTAQSTLSRAFQYKGQRMEMCELFFEPEKGYTSTDPIRIQGNDTLSLRLLARLADSTTLIQTYRIPAQGYHIHCSLEGLERYVTDGHLHLLLDHRIRPMEKDLQALRTRTALNYYFLSAGETAEGETFEELEPLGAGVREAIQFEETVPLEWVSIKSKFFLIGLFPANAQAMGEASMTDLPAASPHLKHARISLSLPLQNTPEAPFGYALYLGPNDYRMLRDVSDSFVQNLYLGWGLFAWINRTFFLPLFYQLSSLFSSYGLIIFILVLVVRLVLSPLTYRSHMGMAKMKVLKPELDEIKNEYPDDKGKQQSAMMNLYQQAGINPLSGCIPMLLQMPVLLAMFYFFPAMVDFRQQGLWWADDLSSYDSVLDLPFSLPLYGNHVSLFTLLMGISTFMFILYNNQTTSVSPQMKVIQYIMPILPILYLNSYSAALTYYYFIANLVSIGQQMLMRAFVDEKKIHAKLQENKKRNASKKKTSFQQRLEAAMKQQQEQKKQRNKQK